MNIFVHLVTVITQMDFAVANVLHMHVITLMSPGVLSAITIMKHRNNSILIDPVIFASVLAFCVYISHASPASRESA